MAGRDWRRTTAMRLVRRCALAQLGKLNVGEKRTVLCTEPEPIRKQNHPNYIKLLTISGSHGLCPCSRWSISRVHLTTDVLTCCEFGELDIENKTRFPRCQFLVRRYSAGNGFFSSSACQ